MLADLGPRLMSQLTSGCPYQSTIDNCDLYTEHLTVESIEKETIDTSSLCSKKMTKEEALTLFSLKRIFFLDLTV